MSPFEVFIIGGGPSLLGFDFTRLRGKKTIAVNKAVFYAPNPDYFITHDLTFFKKIDLNKFSQIQTTKYLILCPVTFRYTEIIKDRIYDRRPYPESPWGYDYDIRLINFIIISKEEKGIGFNWDDFRHGENSGYSALQFAVIMQFNPIYLLGFDMNVHPGVAHWHEGYGEDPAQVQKRLDYYYHNFYTGLQELKNKKPWIEIYSLSPRSSLNNIIPYKDMDEVL